MRIISLLTTLCVLLTLPGCGAGANQSTLNKGAKSDIKELRALRKSIDTRLKTLSAPIKSAKGTLKRLSTTPMALKLTAAEYTQFLNEVLRGKEPSLAKETGTERAKKLQTLATDLSAFRQAIATGLGDTQALGEALVKDLAHATKIVLKIKGRAKAMGRTFARRNEKMKAKKNERIAKRIERKIRRKLKKARKQLADMPESFARVAVDFQNVLTRHGVKTFNALETVEQQLAREAKARGAKAVAGATEGVQDAVMDVASPAMNTLKAQEASARAAADSAVDQANAKASAVQAAATNTVDDAIKDAEAKAAAAAQTAEAAANNAKAKAAAAVQTAEAAANNAKGKAEAAAAQVTTPVESALKAGNATLKEAKDTAEKAKSKAKKAADEAAAKAAAATQAAGDTAATAADAAADGAQEAVKEAASSDE